MTCICAKEVLFFGAESRDTSQLLYLLLTVHKPDLIGLKNRRFCLVENDRKGKNGLKPKPIFFFTVYRLRGVVVFGNFTQIRECSSTVKNQPNL
jgi:hypothetical protein